MGSLNFSKKQAGYGRQELYFHFDNEKFFVQSVFPNVEEHFGITHNENCFYDEDKKIYTDCNGHETTPYSNLDEFLTESLKERIGEILYESLYHGDFDFDFENATYEEITEWAINYN